MSRPGKAQSPTFAREWNRADSLAARGLPKSALDVVGRIYTEARRAKNYPQVVKAAMHRLVYRTYLDENDYAELVRTLAADIRETPVPARSVLQSVQAQIYWRYYQQNRHRFLNRSVEEPTPASADTAIDPRTWDIGKLMATITRLYDTSLADRNVLQQTPVAAYEVLLEKGDPEARLRRPTLYDLLAHRALAFYQDTEVDITRPAFKFELDQPAYFRDAETFGKLSVQTRDSLALRFRALRLYQKLIRFHLNEKNPLPLADVDNWRLQFVHRYSVLPEKDSLYRQSLEQGAARYKNSPAEAEYLYPLARLLAGSAPPQAVPLIPGEPKPADPRNRWDRKRAADLCRDLIRRFPQTLPAKNAASLLSQLTASSLTLQLEQVNEPKQPFRALVSYQNVPKFYFRTVKISVDENRQLASLYDEKARRQRFAGLLRRRQVTFGTVNLPDDGDLHQHRTEMPLGALPTGHYALLVSRDERLATDSTLLAFTTITVSNLGYLQREESPFVNYELYVVNRVNGQPMPNAAVSILTVSKEKSSFLLTTKPDADGRVPLPALKLKEGTSYFYRITLNGDTLDTDLRFPQRFYPQPPAPENERVLLFTDRAIYRPGQPIYFKGVLYRGKANQYTVVSGEEVKVDVNDANGESVTSLTLRANEFGTFEGRLTAPVGRATGQMMLQTPFGAVSFRVEEYKRPTFEVTIDTLQQAYKLGQTITLNGVARTFSGAVVDGAQVRYRVTRRQSLFPWLRSGGPGWRIFPPRSATETEITNGVLTTDATGAVRLTFTADPDRSVPRTQNPLFDFVVTLDVTDRAGETRSATQTLQLGYSALKASLTVPERIDNATDETVPLRVTNTAGKPVSVRAHVTVYRLKGPERQLRQRLWEAPDRYILNRADYNRLFPHDLYANEDEPASWPKGEAVQEASLTGKTPALTLQTRRFEPGEYVAHLSATDSTGEIATQDVYFSVMNSRQPTASRLPQNWLSVQKETVEVGQEAVFFVGNAQPGRVLMSISEENKIVRQEWLTTDGTPRRVVIPIEEKHRGGLAVQFVMVQNGRLLSETRTIQVPFTNKRLTVTTETFRDKLKPGQPDEWTLRISGPDKDKVLAELAATLYDASLDAFVKHDWQSDVYQPTYGYVPNWRSGAFDLSQTQNWWSRYEAQPADLRLVYDQLNTFALFGGRPVIRVVLNRTNGGVGGMAHANGPIAGLTIRLKGGKAETVTNEKGQFALSVGTVSAKTAVTLVLSMPGYRSQEVKIVNGRSAVITLSSDWTQLEEEIYVGYGDSRKGARKMVSLSLRGSVAMAPQAKESLDFAASVQEAPQPESSPQLPLQPRRNFSETAFFFPSLKTDAQGRVVLKFTMPDALTRWKLLAFAHTKDLKTGLLEKEIITQKELMVTANAPRFFREGDTLRLTARLNNLSDKALSGTARLDLTNALTGEPLGASVISRRSPASASFAMKAGQSEAVAWTLVIPTGLPPVTVRVTATAGNFSDAEEQTIPVLPNRMLVTETLPFWANGNESKTFRLDALAKLNPELPTQHERLAVEVTSNPAWYALQSLPYLMEYPYECAEQLFSRVYAHSLAAHIVGSRPEFRQQLEQWKKTPPTNPLEANAELKSITLENTPWLRDARSQTEQQAKLANLLDTEKVTAEQQRAVEKLKALQADNGGFRWFGGMQPDLTMTLHILASYGHLRKLGVRFPASVEQSLNEMLPKAVAFVDAELLSWQGEQKKQKVAGYGGYLPAQFLYARSFYPEQALEKTLLADLQKRLAADWLNQPLQTQVLTALALHRFNTAQTPQAILASLRERAKVSDELGMYWPENEAGSFWYQAPIETQAYAIEAFSEVAADLKTVDNLKKWLLRQKQTQAWPSTKATTEAVYALLLRGSDWLQTKPTTDVKVGTVALASRTDKAEALTGYQKVTFAPAEIKPDMGRVEVSKKGTGPAWGALYWQHFEPMDRVAQGNVAGSAGLSVEKALFLQKDSPSGPVVTPVTPQTRLQPGDLVKVRVVLRTDRTMEYVHLKDGRASGFEPVTVLSGYKYQNGLSYYEAPRDASTDFFLSYLPTGTHVFEYDLRVVHAGDFTSGVATVQCFYAPEFAAHSNGGRIVVK